MDIGNMTKENSDNLAPEEYTVQHSLPPPPPLRKPAPAKTHKPHSICIPRMDANVSKGYIFNVFRNMKIGYIENIVEVPIKSDALYKRVFIKIKWNKSAMAQYINERFNSDLNVKVVHALPWYWICVSNLGHH